MKTGQFKLGQHGRDWTVKSDSAGVLHLILKTPGGELKRSMSDVSDFIEKHGSIDPAQLAALPDPPS
jgi:hypothetical protein